MLSSPSGDGTAVGAADAGADPAGDPDALAAAEADGLALLDVHAAMIGASAATLPTAAMRSSTSRRVIASLDHVADERLLEVDARAVVPIVHVGSSSSAVVEARISASLGDQAMSTSLPTGWRSPAFGASTVMDSPPRVRTWYCTLPPR